jgi:hypothetical protein
MCDELSSVYVNCPPNKRWDLSEQSKMQVKLKVSAVVKKCRKFAKPISMLCCGIVSRDAQQ